MKPCSLQVLNKKAVICSALYCISCLWSHLQAEPISHHLSTEAGAGCYFDKHGSSHSHSACLCVLQQRNNIHTNLNMQPLVRRTTEQHRLHVYLLVVICMKWKEGIRDNSDWQTAERRRGSRRTGNKTFIERKQERRQSRGESEVKNRLRAREERKWKRLNEKICENKRESGGERGNMERGKKRAVFGSGREEMKGEVRSGERRRGYLGLRKAPRCFSMQLICILISQQETNQLIQFCLSVSLFIFLTLKHTHTHTVVSPWLQRSSFLETFSNLNHTYNLSNPTLYSKITLKFKHFQI